MKKIKVLIALCLITSIARAQKVIEKNLDHNDRYVELRVPFASKIDIKTWDKGNVYFKAHLDTEYDQYLDLYDIDFKETGSSIIIASDTKAIFEAFQNERKKTKKNYYYSEYTFDYTLYVPKNSEFKVTSINGDMQSDRIEGDFEADLINGNIEIKSYSGNLKLNTINGEIDLKVGNASFTAETIHGDIYADESLKLTSDNRHVGQKVQSASANGPNKLKLNTINGNMYLRL